MVQIQDYVHLELSNSYIPILATRTQ